MMYGNTWNNSAGSALLGGWMGTWLGVLLIPLVLWSLFWKGWALWVAARNGNKAWFIALLIINTAGILDIIYIFFFGKQKAVSTNPARKSVRRRK